MASSMGRTTEGHGRFAAPSHVPPERVIDLDYFSPPGAEVDPHLAWKRLHDGPDIVFSPYNGGHWILTRAEDMFAVMQDSETFSNAEFTVPVRGAGNPLLMPNQLDPPMHGPIRSIVLRPLSPRAVEPLISTIRNVIRKRIASIAPHGRCEFVADFAADIPPEIFLAHAQMDTDRLVVMKTYADTIVRSESESERRDARIGAARYMEEILDERRRGELGDDIFSVVVRAEQDGKVTREQSASIALNVFLGGLETVSSALAFIILFLARNPLHRRQLAEDPLLSADATEELLRRYGILNMARIATRHPELKGIRIKAGEQVLLPLHLASLDDRRFPDPLTVDFHRKQAAHYNFGTGPHRCLGSNLARLEIRIFIEEWMRQIPDFSEDPKDLAVGSSGVAMTMTHVPLIWAVPAAARQEQKNEDHRRPCALPRARHLHAQGPQGL